MRPVVEGKPLDNTDLTGGIAVDFWSHVYVGRSHECWPWRESAPRHSRGYGLYHGEPAHRTAFRLHYGFEPDNVDHLCVGGGAARIPCTWKASRARRTPGEVPGRMTQRLVDAVALSHGSLAAAGLVVAPSVIDAVSEPVYERPDWDSYFLAGALWVSSRADCRRRQHGAIITDTDHRIIATGYNGSPAGDLGCLAGACPRGLLSYDEIKEFSDYDSGPGLCISIHAEANAALYAGSRAVGGTIYVTGEPCRRCFVTIRGARLGRLVYLDANGEKVVKSRDHGTL